MAIAVEMGEVKVRNEILRFRFQGPMPGPKVRGNKGIMRKVKQIKRLQAEARNALFRGNNRYEQRDK